MSLRVESPGLLSTLQALGRAGYQHLGVGPGGALDEVSHRLANLLVGNPPGAPTLEITLVGPRLRFEQDSLMALGGADLSATLDGQPLPLWRPVLVRTGTCLAFGKPRLGARSYLAVEGGFEAPSLLGSASTHLGAGFGGFQGRALRAGDRLRFGPAPSISYPRLRQRFAQERGPCLAPDWFAPWFRELDFGRPALLGLVPGPQGTDLTPASRTALLEGEFPVSPDSNRMGIRLQGPALALERPREMISSGVATGTLQLPPDGHPILLLADRQTTGGYPRLGEVATVDLPKAAQLRPGESLRFASLSLEEAQARLRQRETRLQELEAILADRRDHG